MSEYHCLVSGLPDISFDGSKVNFSIEKFKEVWSSKGYGWICEKHSDCKKTPGYTNLIAFYGSSTYDTAQMSHMIDMVVEDCKQQGIETLPPEDLAVLVGRWGA